MKKSKIVIGGASGFWGDSARSTPQLLQVPNIDYIVYDYLAEITMSIMARARAADDQKGYALDFVSQVMRTSLKGIADKGVKIISNAGGVNPQACAAALENEIKQQGLDLKVACITGDDLSDKVSDYAQQGIQEMFTGEKFPATESVQSVNAYLGAFPIAEALNMGADIVITGRCVDSAVTLGACIHEFSWQFEDWDKLAMGSLAGHLIECGPQATGGNFTDWHLVSDRIHEIGYPIAEIEADGSFICSKPEGSGGLVNVGTVAEQMLYEIGNPQEYVLPDVVCDFSQVALMDLGDDRVEVRGAKGRPAPAMLKVCSTYVDAFRGGTLLSFYGLEAERKARAFAQAVFKACDGVFAQHGLSDFEQTSVEILGAESQYGEQRTSEQSREVVLKIAAKHAKPQGIALFLLELVGLGLATPPGLCGFQGGRSKPSPVLKLFSFLIPKESVVAHIEFQGSTKQWAFETESWSETDTYLAESPDQNVDLSIQATTKVPLIKLAWARSGDKGNIANVGVIARKPEFYPYIAAALTEAKVKERFQHFLDDAWPEQQGEQVERFFLPGVHAINFVLHAVLGGGGVASLRNDPQGKGYSQLLLEAPITVPTALLEKDE